MASGRNSPLIFHVCPKVLQKLLLTYVEKQAPQREWTLDHFLHQHQPVISSSTIGFKRHRVFFPGFGKCTCLENWDLHMLLFVLSTICKNEGALRFQGILNYLCKVQNEDPVNRLFDEVKEIIRYWLTEINETNFTREVENQIREIEEGRTQALDTAECLLTWHMTGKELREPLKDVPTPLRPLAEKVDKIISLKEMKIGQEKAVSPRSENLCSVDSLVPGINVVAVTGGHNHKETSNRIVSSMSRTLDECNNRTKELTNRLDRLDQVARDVKQSLEQTYDADLLEVTHNCVEIFVKCHTMTALVKLLEDSTNGRLTEMFTPIGDEIKSQPGFENFSLEVVVYRDDYENCMETIAKNLNVFLGEIEGTEEEEKYLEEALCLPGDTHSKKKRT